MRNGKTTLLLLVGLLVCGLLAVGCGDDEESTSDTPAVESTGEDSGSEDLEATTEEDSGSEDSGSSEIDSEGVYTACTDAIAGTPAEDAGQQACEQARDAFEQCASAAEGTGGEDTAIQICQDAADQAIKALESASPQGY